MKKINLMKQLLFFHQIPHQTELIAADIFHIIIRLRAAGITVSRPAKEAFLIQHRQTLFHICPAVRIGFLLRRQFAGIQHMAVTHVIGCQRKPDPFILRNRFRHFIHQMRQILGTATDALFGIRAVVDIQSANRDARCLDDPHVVRLDANAHRNLTFGAGLHKCMGMIMARFMAKQVMHMLLSHLKGMEYVYSRWRFGGDNHNFQSPEFLNVRMAR